jgi:hypothetical protein
MGGLGLFFSHLEKPRAAVHRDREASASGLRSKVGLLTLVVVSVLSGLTMRPYLQAVGLNGGHMLSVGNRAWIEKRAQVANFLLAECGAWARSDRDGTPPRIPVHSLVSLIPEPTLIYELGRVLIPHPTGGGWAVIPPGSPLPPDGVVEITRPWDTHFHGMERVARWADELARLDGRAPREPELALHISRMYKLLAEQASEKQADRQVDYLQAMAYWAEEAVSRSTLHKDMHENLGWVYWTLAGTTSGSARTEYYQRALEAFAEAQRLGHLEPRYYFAHAGALEAYGQIQGAAGDEAAAARFFSAAARVREAGLSLQSKRWSRGLQ